MNRKGFAPIVILLILAGVLIIGAAGYFYSRNHTQTPIVQSSPVLPPAAPIPTSSSTTTKAASSEASSSPEVGNATILWISSPAVGDVIFKWSPPVPGGGELVMWAGKRCNPGGAMVWDWPADYGSYPYRGDVSQFCAQILTGPYGTPLSNYVVFDSGQWYSSATTTIPVVTSAPPTVAVTATTSPAITPGALTFSVTPDSSVVATSSAGIPTSTPALVAFLTNVVMKENSFPLRNPVFSECTGMYKVFSGDGSINDVYYIDSTGKLVNHDKYFNSVLYIGASWRDSVIYRNCQVFATSTTPLTVPGQSILTFISPQDNTTVSGTVNIVISATNSNTIGSLWVVVDKGLDNYETIGPATTTSNGLYSFRWDTTKEFNGENVLWAFASSTVQNETANIGVSVVGGLAYIAPSCGAACAGGPE
jgi:hypothetical protein